MKLAPGTLSEKAYFEIRNRILRGDYPMGSPLVEENMTALLGISRTPVRTALGRLLAEGFLVQGEDRTLRIPTLTRKELSETFEARRCIESTVVSLACLRAKKEQISKLENLIWSEREAYQRREQVLISAMDRMFHNLLAEISGNRLFREFVEKINNQVSLFLALSNTLGSEIDEALEEHEQILEMIRRKDTAGGSQAMLNHLTRVEERIVTRIENSKDKVYACLS